MLNFFSVLFVFSTVIQVLVGAPIVSKVPTDALDTTDARGNADIPQNGQTDAIGNGPTDALDTTDARGNADISQNDPADAVGNGPADTLSNGTEYADELDPAEILGNGSSNSSHRQFKACLGCEKVVNCYSAFRHKDNAPPELIAKANQLGIKDRKRGDAPEELKCYGGCQTIICYEKGFPIYAMKGCFTRGSEGCDHHIRKFCAKDRHAECVNCETDLCNNQYIEIPLVIRIESMNITANDTKHLHASLLTALALLFFGLLCV